MQQLQAGLDAGGKLTTEAKGAIDAYLLRYVRAVLGVVAFFGLTTLASVGLSLGYVFFRLPDEAADKAFAAWDAKFSRYEERIEDTLAQALELQADAKVAQRQIEELERILPAVSAQVTALQDESTRLTETVGGLSESDLARAAEIASTLNAQTVAEAIRSANGARAEAIEARRLVRDLSRRLEEAEGLLRDQILRTNGLQPLGTEEETGERDATGSPVRQ